MVLDFTHTQNTGLKCTDMSYCKRMQTLTVLLALRTESELALFMLKRKIINPNISLHTYGAT